MSVRWLRSLTSISFRSSLSQPLLIQPPFRGRFSLPLLSRHAVNHTHLLRPAIIVTILEARTKTSRARKAASSPEEGVRRTGQFRFSSVMCRPRYLAAGLEGTRGQEEEIIVELALTLFLALSPLQNQLHLRLSTRHHHTTPCTLAVPFAPLAPDLFSLPNLSTSFSHLDR